MNEQDKRTEDSAKRVLAPNSLDHVSLTAAQIEATMAVALELKAIRNILESYAELFYLKNW